MCIIDSLRRAATASFSGPPKLTPTFHPEKLHSDDVFVQKSDELADWIIRYKYTFNMRKHPDDVATIKLADSKGKVRVDEPISKLVRFLDETHHHYGICQL